MSHLGRPDGKKNAKYSLKPVLPELEKQLGKSVTFTDDCVGKDVEETVNKAKDGEVILLENLRFHIEEEGSAKNEKGEKVKADKKDVEEFRKGLTALGDVYISTFSKLKKQEERGKRRLTLHALLSSSSPTTKSTSKTNKTQTTPLAPPTAPTPPWSASPSQSKPAASS
jgi:soluble cytochrome b562